MCSKRINCVVLSIILTTSSRCLHLTAAFVSNLNQINKYRSPNSKHYSLSVKNTDEAEESRGTLQRRAFLSNSILPATTFSLFSWIDPNIPEAQARGLVKFPCKDYIFLNTYHFVRAGESLLEEEGVWSTNPLFLTNREAALSQKGIDQIEKMCEKLRADEISPTIVRYSLAASAIDSCNIIGKELKVGRDRLVPEFNFMDPRAIGSYDMSLFDTSFEAVWAMDVDEAGSDGIGGRPPSNEDGTPNETLADQVVRLRQLLSVLETQYSGDTILLVFPDGTGPALLSCLIGGIPLNRVHEFNYRSGEVRLDVNYESTHAYLLSQPPEDYKEAISRGREKLISLRENPGEFINYRDQQYAEQLRKDEEKREMLRVEQEKKELKMAEAQELRKKEEQEAKERKLALEQQKKKLELEKKETKLDSSSRSAELKSSSMDSNMVAVGGLAAISAVGASAMFGEEKENLDEDILTTTPLTLSENVTESHPSTLEKMESCIEHSNESASGNTTVAEPLKATFDVEEKHSLTLKDAVVDPMKEERDKVECDNHEKMIEPIKEEATTKKVAGGVESDEKDQDPATSLEMSSSQNIAISPAPVVSSSSEKQPQAWDPNEDDGGLAWLGSLNEMMDED